MGLVGSHAFARMEGDVDKQRKLILQGQMSEAAQQKTAPKEVRCVVFSLYSHLLQVPHFLTEPLTKLPCTMIGWC